MEKVKLQIYSLENDITYLDSYYAEDFGSFVLIALNFGDMTDEQIGELYLTFKEAVGPDRVAIIVDRSLELSVHGFREIEELPILEEAPDES